MNTLSGDAPLQWNVQIAPAPFARLRTYDRRTIFVEAGTESDAVHLIREGPIRVFLLQESGAETTTSVLGPGQLLGLASLVGLRQYESFAQALTDAETWAMPTSPPGVPGQRATALHA